MNIYKTAEVAAVIGVHPNTVRLYEEWELIPKPKRQPNGYRIFTDFHIEQFKLARLAFRIEVLQNGLRKKIVQIVKVSATSDFDKALSLATEYLEQLQRERTNAKETATLVKEILSGENRINSHFLKRKEVSEYLNISMDTLHHIYDFKLMNNLYLLGNGSESFEPISSEMCSEIQKLPFSEHMEIVYAAHSQPASYSDGIESSYYLRVKVKNAGILAADFKRAKLEKMTYDFDMTEYILTKYLNQKTITQRLREFE